MGIILLCAIQPDLGDYLNDEFLKEAQQFPSLMMIRPTREGVYPEYRNEQSQINLQSMQNRLDVPSDVSSASTGIKIRSRQSNNQRAQNLVSHGTAPRRIRLQMKLQVGSTHGCLAKNTSLPDENMEVPIIEVSKLSYFQSISFAIFYSQV